MKKIILDTNFAVIPFQFKVDIYSEINRLFDEKYELVFPEICLKELERLKPGKAALALMEKKGVKFENMPAARKVDDSILNYAVSASAVVATQDRELKKKALKNGLLVISLRKKQFLIKTGGRVE